MIKNIKFLLKENINLNYEFWDKIGNISKTALIKSRPDNNRKKTDDKQYRYLYDTFHSIVEYLGDEFEKGSIITEIDITNKIISSTSIKNVINQIKQYLDAYIYTEYYRLDMEIVKSKPYTSDQFFDAYKKYENSLRNLPKTCFQMKSFGDSNSYKDHIIETPEISFRLPNPNPKAEYSLLECTLFCRWTLKNNNTQSHSNSEDYLLKDSKIYCEIFFRIEDHAQIGWTEETLKNPRIKASVKGLYGVDISTVTVNTIKLRPLNTSLNMFKKLNIDDK